MSRPPNVPTTILLATARWLQCIHKLSVKAMRRFHEHTATDRIAAVCRFVKAEARQRALDARAHGIVAEPATGRVARRAARPRRMVQKPAQRAPSAIRAPHPPRPSVTPRTAGAPHRAMPSSHGPRAAVIAALEAETKHAHDALLQQLDAAQRQLQARLADVERQIAAQASTQAPATMLPAPAMAKGGGVNVLFRRLAVRASVFLRRLLPTRP